MIEVFEHLDLEVVEIAEGQTQLLQIEEEISKHLQKSTTHSQIAYVLFASIRHNHLYVFAHNVDGGPIATWEEYVQNATFRFGISRSWAYTATKLYRLGLILGFSETELLDIDMNTLTQASKVLQYTRRGRLPTGGAESDFPIEIVNEENIGIEEGWNIEEKKVRLKEFVEELNLLPPDERRRCISEDILEKTKYFYQLDNNYEILWSTNEDQTVRNLREGSAEVRENFRARIGDRS